MNIRLIQQLFAVCLMSLLLPGAALAATTAYAYNVASIPVPESVTFGLLAIGIFGLLLLNRRPKKSDI